MPVIIFYFLTKLTPSSLTLQPMQKVSFIMIGFVLNCIRITKKPLCGVLLL